MSLRRQLNRLILALCLVAGWSAAPNSGAADDAKATVDKPSRETSEKEADAKKAPPKDAKKAQTPFEASDQVPAGMALDFPVDM